jgi:tetratricopeptide (TPR) repeat protein
VAVDRDSTLKKAEKLLRQGRLEGAIAEYVQVVEAFPKDWTTANTLGDLYVRAGQPDMAAAQYVRIADHFAHEGFFPKAAALYKKILKIRPDDEAITLSLAELSAKQGLLADAKAHLTSVADRRRTRGDKAGAREIVIRLGSLDPADVDARRLAALAVAESGDPAGAAQRFREIAADLTEKGSEAEALDMLREVVRHDPDDRETRARLARAALGAGQFDQAQAWLSREVAGDDPVLREALVEIEMRAGRVDEALSLIRDLLATNADVQPQILQFAWTLGDSHPDAAFTCVEAVVERTVATGEHERAAAILREFTSRIPRHVPTLLKLVEVCIDGGLESTMYEAQIELAEAYLDAGQALEASVIAEDLVAREPWERAHIDRFRRALVMLKTPNPDAVIAERLSGQSPFTATDPFIEVEETPPAAEPEPAPEPAAPPPPGAPPASTAISPHPAFQIAASDLDLSRVLVAPPGRVEKTMEPELPPAQPSRNLDQVFQTFRDEASRDAAQIQGEQHLALARTYQEMGMLDEATQALQVAVRSPRHRFEAASMLASISRQRGELPQAIEWMERALEAPAPSPDASHALLYTLGETLEGLGEVARALAVFIELQAEAGDYRDLAARIERLAQAQAGG